MSGKRTLVALAGLLVFALAASAPPRRPARRPPDTRLVQVRVRAVLDGVTDPSPAESRFRIVPGGKTVNPDGARADERTNDHGVDLNRNF